MHRKPDKTNRRRRVSYMDNLWRMIVLARADYKSEISRSEGPLEAHHIAKKPNDRLRFMLYNGVCLTYDEHRKAAHSDNVKIKSEFEKRIKELRGDDVYDRLAEHRWIDKVDFAELIKLQKELEHEYANLLAAGEIRKPVANYKYWRES